MRSAAVEVKARGDFSDRAFVSEDGHYNLMVHPCKVICRCDESCNMAGRLCISRGCIASVGVFRIVYR